MWFIQNFLELVGRGSNTDPDPIGADSHPRALGIVFRPAASCVWHVALNTPYLSGIRVERDREPRRERGFDQILQHIPGEGVGASCLTLPGGARLKLGKRRRIFVVSPRPERVMGRLWPNLETD
jgi:hypothetical protein